MATSRPIPYPLLLDIEQHLRVAAQHGLAPFGVVSTEPASRDAPVRLDRRLLEQFLNRG